MNTNNLILTVLLSNMTRSMAIVGTSAIMTLRKAFAMERSTLLRTKVSLSNSFSIILKWGLLSFSPSSPLNTNIFLENKNR